MPAKCDWKKIIEEWAGSGLSVNDFCGTYKLPRTSFYKYRKQFGTHHGDSTMRPKKQASTKLSKNVQKNDNIRSPQETLQFAEVIATTAMNVHLSPTIKITTKSGNIWEIFL